LSIAVKKFFTLIILASTGVDAIIVVLKVLETTAERPAIFESVSFVSISPVIVL
jgi:hypothetical protein